MSNNEQETFDFKSYITEKSLNMFGFGNFRVNYVKQVNMLLVGCRQSGKSTIISTLINSQLSVDFPSTKVPSCHHLTVYNEESKDYVQLNVIDTPEYEVAHKQRKMNSCDEKLLNLLERLIEENIYALNIICFVSKVACMNQNDIELFNVIERFLGPETSEITMMVLTHCDEYSTDDIKALENNIRDQKLSKSLYRHCKLGLFTLGAINKAAVFKEEITTKIMEEKLEGLENMRNKFLKTVCESYKKRKFVKIINNLEKKKAKKLEEIVHMKMKDKFQPLEPQSESKTKELLRKHKCLTQ